MGSDTVLGAGVLGCLIRQDPWPHGNGSLMSNINLHAISGPQVRSLGVDQKEAHGQSRRHPSEQEGSRGLDSLEHPCIVGDVP